ncbi:hypothetical protein G6F50_017768 [Rhizopus delemar]|uniref:Uncharacterized protein n=1 Tax=Rhizopus delemar TaxID=936053 RepID=A0A9P6XPD2_9FUNG|nr:hypothetical protein G6F50_017768 [Rhizopus delemar]
MRAAGWRATKPATARARWLCPNDTLAVTRSVPCGSGSSLASSPCSASPISSICRKRANAASPGPVRQTRRLVRCSRRAPTQPSPAAT